MQKLAQSFYRVRFPDCDPFGHLNNSRFIDYMLNAREDHLAHVYQVELNSFYKQGLGWMVSSHDIQYLRPALYNENVCIQSRLIESNGTSLLVEILMWDEAVQSCKAILWTRFTHVSLRTGRKENHSPQFMELLNTLADGEGIIVSRGAASRVEVFTGKSR